MLYNFNYTNTCKDSIYKFNFKNTCFIYNFCYITVGNRGTYRFTYDCFDEIYYENICNEFVYPNHEIYYKNSYSEFVYPDHESIILNLFKLLNFNKCELFLIKNILSVNTEKNIKIIKTYVLNNNYKSFLLTSNIMMCYLHNMLEYCSNNFILNIKNKREFILNNLLSLATIPQNFYSNKESELKPTTKSSYKNIHYNLIYNPISSYKQNISFYKKYINSIEQSVNLVLSKQNNFLLKSWDFICGTRQKDISILTERIFIIQSKNLCVLNPIHIFHQSKSAYLNQHFLFSTFKLIDIQTIKLLNVIPNEQFEENTNNNLERYELKDMILNISNYRLELISKYLREGYIEKHNISFVNPFDELSLTTTIERFIRYYQYDVKKYDIINFLEKDHKDYAEYKLISCLNKEFKNIENYYKVTKFNKGLKNVFIPYNTKYLNKTNRDINNYDLGNLIELYLSKQIVKFLDIELNLNILRIATCKILNNKADRFSYKNINNFSIEWRFELNYLRDLLIELNLYISDKKNKDLNRINLIKMLTKSLKDILKSNDIKIQKNNHNLDILKFSLLAYEKKILDIENEHELKLWARFWFLYAVNITDEKVLPYYDFPYENNPITFEGFDDLIPENWQVTYPETFWFGIDHHPIQQGKNLGLEEIPLAVNIMIELINVLILIWFRFYPAFWGWTGTQAVLGITSAVFEWITLETSRLKQDEKNSRIHYDRCYRWLRWEAEKIALMARNDMELKGNHYVSLLLEELINYMLDHHFDTMPIFIDVNKMDEWRRLFNRDLQSDIKWVLDKIKGIRHKLIIGKEHKDNV